MRSDQYRTRVVKGTPKHLSRKGELDSFTYLMINLEFLCNYNCSKCFNQGKDRTKYDADEILSLGERLDAVRQAEDLGGKVVVIAGEGEPSMHKDIRTLVEAINSHNVTPIIYSNGRLIDEELAGFYRKNNAVIVISLDSLNPERYDKLTGTTGQLECVLRNIEGIRTIYGGPVVEGDLNVLNVALNTTVSSVNHDEIAAIKRFCADDIYFICNPIVKLGAAATNWKKLIRKGEAVEDFKKLIGHMSESGGPLTLGKDGLCNYSKWGIAINPAGHFMTCAYTNKTDGLLGNIRDTSLRQAFHHKMREEAAFYACYGQAPCLVRHESFSDYIDNLRKK